jgi:hypothetical protein
MLVTSKHQAGQSSYQWLLIGVAPLCPLRTDVISRPRNICAPSEGWPQGMRAVRTSPGLSCRVFRAVGTALSTQAGARRHTTEAPYGRGWQARCSGRRGPRGPRPARRRRSWPSSRRSARKGAGVPGSSAVRRPRTPAAIRRLAADVHQRQRGRHRYRPTSDSQCSGEAACSSSSPSPRQLHEPSQSSRGGDLSTGVPPLSRLLRVRSGHSEGDPRAPQRWSGPFPAKR